MKMFFLITVSFCVIKFPGFSQEYGTLMDLTPMQPNMAQLFKTWEKPNGTYTGIVPLNIPVYMLSSKGVSLPVSLDYTGGGGIKVEEIASTVGLGWNLSAGGTITRIKHGLLDETTHYGYLDCTTKPTGFSATYANLLNYTYGVYDLEPDLFLFSFNGISGRFAFDTSAKIVLLDRPADIIIKPVWTVASSDTLFGGFTITDIKGNIFYFGLNKDRSYGAGDYDLTDYYANGWKLVQICDRNGQEIASLKYVQAQIYYKARTQAYITKYFGWGETSGCGSGDYGGGDYDKTIGAFETYISSIKMGGDSIAFTYGYPRLDLDGGLILNKITINDEAGNLRKKFHFNYNYFIASGASTGTNELDGIYKRLKLLNFAELPSSGTDSLTYTFTYNEDVTLPNRLSASTDYWGYYNGTMNYSVIPNGVYYYGTKVGVTDGGDRRTYHGWGAANILTRITFPIGGYREFNYEGNQVPYGENYLNDNIWCDNDDHTYQFFDGSSFNNSNPLISPAYTQDFTVNSDYGDAIFFFDLNGWASDFKVKIIDKNGSWETVLTQFDDELSNYYLVPNGNYRLELYYDSYGSFSNVSAWWNELDITSTSLRDVGGQRIKFIDDYDPVAGRHLYTHFKYYQPSDTTISSGALISKPALLMSGGCSERDCDLIRISSIGAYPLVNEMGSYVCYPHVRVKESGNGYVDREYTFAEESGWGFEFPPPAIQSNRAYRGKLLSEMYYNESGQLVKKDTIAYHYPPLPWVTTYGIRIAINKLDPYEPIYCTSDGGLAPTREIVPALQWSTEYKSGSTLETKTEYNYFDNLQRNGVSRTKSINSNGDSIITWYRYPYTNNADFKLPLSAYERSIKDTLVYFNILEPIEITIWAKRGSDSTLISGTKMCYDFFSNNIHLSKLKKFSGLSDSTVANFTNYDSEGNLREQFVSNNVKEVYLWGYNNKYIVAKILGSDYNTVASYVNNSVLQNPSSESALRGELDNIRSMLAGRAGRVTTYTYLPSVGVSSTTDIEGKTTYYEYDFYNRLRRVRNHNNKIIQNNTYSITQ